MLPVRAIYARGAGRKTLILLGVVRQFFKRQQWKPATKLTSAEASSASRCFITAVPAALAPSPIAPVAAAIPLALRTSRQAAALSPSFGASALLNPRYNYSAVYQHQNEGLKFFAQPIDSAVSNFEQGEENVFQSSALPLCHEASPELTALRDYAMLGMNTSTTKDSMDNSQQIQALGAFANLALEPAQPAGKSTSPAAGATKEDPLLGYALLAGL